MATEKVQESGIMKRMKFGGEHKPDITPEQAYASKWAIFKYLFSQRMGTLAALSLLTSIFAAPAIVVVALFSTNVSVLNSLLPYSANLGLGYPVVSDAAARGELISFTYSFYEFLFLIPCIMIFALGAAGNLYVMRKLVWDEKTRTFKDFFVGIKKCWLQALITGLAIGCAIFFFIFSLGYFDAHDLGVGLKVACVILSSILLVFVSVFSAFFMTQSAAFDMKAGAILKNSLLFVVGTHITSVIFVAISISPALLALIPQMSIFVLILYVFLGFSFSSLALTCYCHFCYERFLYDKVDFSRTAIKPSAESQKQKTPEKTKSKASAASAIAENVATEGGDIAEQQKKPQKTALPYKNPKKGRK